MCCCCEVEGLQGVGRGGGGVDVFDAGLCCVYVERTENQRQFDRSITGLGAWLLTTRVPSSSSLNSSRVVRALNTTRSVALLGRAPERRGSMKACVVIVVVDCGGIVMCV